MNENVFLSSCADSVCRFSFFRLFASSSSTGGGKTSCCYLCGTETKERNEKFSFMWWFFGCLKAKWIVISSFLRSSSFCDRVVRDCNLIPPSVWNDESDYSVSVDGRTRHTETRRFCEARKRLPLRCLSLFWRKRCICGIQMSRYLNRRREREGPRAENPKIIGIRSCL